MENQENNKAPQGKKEDKRPRKVMDEGPKFNYFWVYAIMIMFGLILWNLPLFQENYQETNMTDLRQMLENNDVDKIVVANGKEADIFIKDSALTKDMYKKVSRTKFGSINKGPHFFLTVASNDAFDRFI